MLRHKFCLCPAEMSRGLSLFCPILVTKSPDTPLKNVK